MNKKPDKLNVFDTNLVNVSEPNQQLKDNGYVVGQPPSSSEFNYMINNEYLWNKFMNGLTLSYQCRVTFDTGTKYNMTIDTGLH